MASTEGLMPITREFLASFYDKYPFPPLSDDVSSLTAQIRSISSDLLHDFPPSPDETLVVEEADRDPVHKIDENMWKNREHLEEIIFLLNHSHWPPPLKQASTPEDTERVTRLTKIRESVQKALKALETFQAKNSERVFNIVMTYIPQDFRGSLIRQQKERSERNKQAEVDALVNSGGSIHDRYAILWRQQMDRRRQLAQLGSATGVYKTLVKYLVGVPQVLLDFLRTINDDDGPMEEQRQRYGPPLYSLTGMVLSIRLLLLLLLSPGRFEARKIKEHEIAVLEQAVNVYTSEFERFINFISEVFANAPFFISAGALEGRTNDEFKEINVSAGKTHEISLAVDAVNSYIAWNFSVVQGTVNVDIGFSVEHTDDSGRKTLMLPYKRYESNEGNFCTVMTGNYKLIWDNSYSSFFKKVLRYKVDCIPPVDPTQSADQAEG